MLDTLPILYRCYLYQNCIYLHDDSGVHGSVVVEALGYKQEDQSSRPDEVNKCFQFA
jgi:hypothetical protein